MLYDRSHPTDAAPDRAADPTPTLLVFTRGRRQARRLLPRQLRQQEAVLQGACLAAAVDAGAAAGCRSVVCSPGGVENPAGTIAMAQTGGTFGERLTRAVERRFAAGDGAVLVVPSDVPGLTATHLRQAVTHLRQEREAVVVGPSPDGGLYLLAAAEPLPADLLEGVRWCRRDTRKHLLDRLAATGRPVILLEPLADLDRPADLDQWLARLSGGRSQRGRRETDRRWHPILAALLAALRTLRRPHWRAPSLLSRTARLRISGRAPPALFFA